MMYEQGEIIIVPFPFSDLRNIKQRPVLILSKNRDNKDCDDIITCGITSNLKNTKHSILIENKDLKKGDLPTRSRIKIDKLFTLNKNIVKKRIAQVNKNTLDKVRKEFSKLV